MNIEGLLGKKIGMTQLFDDRGEVHAVTVVEAGPCVVIQVKSPTTDGYSAVQLGFGAARRLNKPLKGHLKGLGEFRFLREFKVDDPSQWKTGQKVGAELFRSGDLVDVIGVSKGRGFAGGVRRYHFRGGPKTHGQSDRTRAPGSIGPGNAPGHVVKGLHMAGHMGDAQVTVRKLRVLESDPVRGLVFIEGAVPGARNGLLRIVRAGKELAAIGAAAGSKHEDHDKQEDSE
ncbi:MAG: 50S ribosomal protein L3 [Dehalococcoidia bacterium]|jgi:large subunit ribosomal protein L3